MPRENGQIGVLCVLILLSVLVFAECCSAKGPVFSDLMPRQETIPESQKITSLVVFNEFLISGHGDGTLKWWNEEYELVRNTSVSSSEIMNLVIFNDFLAIRNYDGKIRFMNENGELEQTILGDEHGGSTLIVFKNYLISTTTNYINWWDENGKVIRFIDKESFFDGIYAEYKGFPLVGRVKNVEVWNIELWDKEKEEYSFELLEIMDHISDMVVFGDFIVIGYFNGNIEFFDVEHGKTTRFLRLHGLVRLMVFDDILISVTLGNDYDSIDFWDKNMSIIKRISGYECGIRSVVKFNGFFVFGCHNGKMEFYDENGNYVQALHSHWNGKRLTFPSYGIPEND